MRGGSQDSLSAWTEQQTPETFWHPGQSFKFRFHHLKQKDLLFLASFRTFNTLQPWEDISLLNGWPRAASQQAQRLSPDPLPAGHIQRVCRVFTAGRSLRIHLSRKKTGARASKRSVSTKPLTAIKVSSVKYIYQYLCFTTLYS